MAANACNINMQLAAAFKWHTKLNQGGRQPHATVVKLVAVCTIAATLDQFAQSDLQLDQLEPVVQCS
jgi:hypothetical protein